ncbi:MAG TPA: ABC transporter substrate-binding protein, partial [Steroidobacteraceae bacterium]
MFEVRGRLTRRRLLAAAASTSAALLAGGLAACGRTGQGSGASGAGASGEAILARGNGPDPDSLDPQKARTVEAQNILRDVFEGLTSVARDGGVAAGVATAWAASPDGRTYTFRLRPEARWSSGDPVVAADFVAGLRRLVDPTTASPYAQVIEAISNAQEVVTGRKPPSALGVSAPDDHTVVVALDAPTPYLPALLSHPSTGPVH